MATYVTADDYRVPGEKPSLLLGFATLAVVLLFITAISVGILTLLLVLITAIVVWVQQSRLVGGSARVSERQFPEINAIARDAAARLSMQQPEVFVVQDPTINAFAIGFMRRKSVVLNSATIEAMEPAELEQIIGHEFSHIKCGHTNLTVLTSSVEGVDVPVVSWLMGFIFLFWSRNAEYTCDRGGLLASRDLGAAVAALCKVAVGPELFKRMNVADFLDQHAAVDGDHVTKLSEGFGTHPYLVKRIHALERFHGSELYRQLTGADCAT